MLTSFPQNIVGNNNNIYLLSVSADQYYQDPSRCKPGKASSLHPCLMRDLSKEDIVRYYTVK